ncbi:hypothetical protein SAVERM_495 [Streptomyces avermitilis MA-4680 = NBRC 14893]|uniref:Uncharacterized protein n=1 Tax=Streptomyces avermitilis (strain ATCC 31267 / DSM 46492 / JCM 5070 / NBRC 14893 / NCIMB 12804 / NRRL 8165 / MA-4680) TaxID=227882 RepID=Q82QL0_STRAW|nr:hypothetical protein SAVERM_495 [Streptomyces avermitilis MA-4680 = NBRC 14893]
MARGGSITAEYGLEVLNTVIYLPRGEIFPITSSATLCNGFSRHRDGSLQPPSHVGAGAVWRS